MAISRVALNYLQILGHDDLVNKLDWRTLSHFWYIITSD